MQETTINTAMFPNPPAMLTVRVGDRVKHHSGITGVVVAINRAFEYVQEVPGGEFSVYGNHIIVQEDKRPRQRKAYAPVRWDGIVAVIA